MLNVENKKECVAMLLAGGQGSRLGILTKQMAKPAVSFGGKYRMIDFTLSNCTNSDIDTVGVLTQYRPYQLNTYIGTGSAWDLDSRTGGVAVLPPYATESGGKWYEGTADAIYQNLDYISIYDPEYVLVLSGDHIYQMDYRDMLKRHKECGADLTIAVRRVPIEEASRFGIMTANEQGRIVEFEEKPKKPKSDLASLGIYIFNRKVLEKALKEDAADEKSSHDFGKNVIPKLLNEGKKLYVFEFNDFWMDVGTIPSLHEASMDLLSDHPAFDIFHPKYPIFSNEVTEPPHFMGPRSHVEQCLMANGSNLSGTAIHSILSVRAMVEEGAYVKDSVLLPGAIVKKGARVIRAILAENAVVEENEIVGSEDPNTDIAVVGERKEGGRGA